MSSSLRRFGWGPRHDPDSGISVIVPCYNEEAAIRDTVLGLNDILSGLREASEIIVVNDGSRDRTDAVLGELTPEVNRLRVIHNGSNLGYGASLKRGIQAASFDRVVIVDADGTYPLRRLPEMVERLTHFDMVVGARVMKGARVPFARRPAKWLLLRYARAMTKADIRDVNSGFRGIWASHLREVWSMLPDGFSFTTTVTLTMHIKQLSVDYVPIEYFGRIGKSSIRPVRDTLRFFALVFRTVMYFKPLPVFGTVAVFLIGLAVVGGTAAKLATGVLPDVTVLSLMSTGLIFLGLGLIGDLINARRSG